MIKNRKIERCDICGESKITLKYSYSSPPKGETVFSFSHNNYAREYWECSNCKHLNSNAVLDLKKLYSGEYGSFTYRDVEGIHKSFDKIINLPAGKSDNRQRVDFLDFNLGRFSNTRKENLTVLDIGSGLGVFPYEMTQRGYKCSALDPDKNAVEHMNSMLKINCYHGDLQSFKENKKFELITFNKVLEHVENPIELLIESKKNLNHGGLFYIELPDAQGASTQGQDREEFFIEHLHVFSLHSTMLLGEKAGLSPLVLERVVEPSSKFTIRSLWKF